MKQTALTAFSLLLAAICVFCAIFSMVMVGRPDTVVENGDENVGENGNESAGKDQNPSDNETPTPDTPSKDDPPVDNTPKKRVAITLDDGPYYALQRKFVDEMKKYGGAGTFFVVGNRVAGQESQNPGLAYAVENGWDIGIHAWTHENFFNSCSDDVYKTEIEKTENIIHKYLPNYDIKLLRPPGGMGYMTSERIAASPYAIIHWDADSFDYNYKTNTADRTKEQNVQAIIDNVMAQVRDGSIVLMHELYENSYLAYCEILKILHEQGYEFVSVTELLGDKFQAGKTFTNGR